MGILAAIDRSVRAEIDGAPGPLNDFWYGEPGLESDSGIRISPQGALSISTVWKCVDWWFRMYGTLPHKLMESTTVNGRPSMIEAVDHELYDLIHSAPNPTMTSEYFHGLIAADKKLWGNFYAFIQRKPNSIRIQALYRIRPDYVTPKLLNGQFWYEIRGDNGVPQKFYPDEILHLPGLGFDGRVGYSPIRMQMNLMGWNRATTRYGAQFFKNASRPSGIITTDNAMKPEAKKELVENMRKSGKEAGKLLLIEGAAKFQKLTMDQDEAQFILTCNMQEEDIAGVMGVFPHEIGITRDANNSITEQLTINTVTRHLTPFCVQTEQQMSLQLLSDLPSSGIGGGTERSRYFFQDELKALMRGDTAAQTLHIKAMRDLGIYDGNDASEYLGNPPFEGGDIRVINGAYVPLDMLREIAKTRKAGDVGAPNGPGGSPPSDNQKAEAKVVHIFDKIKANVSNAYAVLFSDAVGKVVLRKKSEDREKSARGIFQPILISMSRSLGINVEGELIGSCGEFLNGYLAALSQRAAAWDSQNMTAEELNRAVEAIVEHGKMTEFREEVKINA